VASLVLIDLNSQDSWEFQYFPNEVVSNRRVNWSVQETTTGTKPLFYENREPKQLSFTELYLDNTATGESLSEKLKSLEDFTTEEREDRGSPPPMLAVWGDRKLRCVLQDLTVEEKFFNSEGFPTRARISLELIELQPEGEATGVHGG
jgi:hypothetical protein